MTLHSAKGLDSSWFSWSVWKKACFHHSNLLMMSQGWRKSAGCAMSALPAPCGNYNLTYAESRRLYGRESYPRPSVSCAKFLPNSSRKFACAANVSRPVATIKPKDSSLQAAGKYKLGQRVSHVKFGEGVVLQMEGEAHRNGRRLISSKRASSG